MKRVLIALMLCLVSIAGFGQLSCKGLTMKARTSNNTPRNPVGAPEDLPDDSYTEHSLIYPNPTYTGDFNLLYVDYDMPIRLYSPTGVLIKETTRNGYGCCIPFIELSDPRYPNGSYIIEYWYQGRRYAEFIIVIK